MAGWASNDVNGLASASSGQPVRGEAVLLPPPRGPAAAAADATADAGADTNDLTAALLAAALGPRFSRARRRRPSGGAGGHQATAAAAPLETPQPQPPPRPLPAWDDLPPGVMVLVARALCGASMDYGGGPEHHRVVPAPLPPQARFGDGGQEEDRAAAAADYGGQSRRQRSHLRVVVPGDGDYYDVMTEEGADGGEGEEEHVGRGRRRRQQQQQQQRQRPHHARRGRPGPLATLCAVSTLWRRAILGDDALLRHGVEFAACEWRPVVVAAPRPQQVPTAPAAGPAPAAATPAAAAPATERMPTYTTSHGSGPQKLCDCCPKGLPPPLHTRRRVRPLGAPRARDDDPLGVGGGGGGAATTRAGATEEEGDEARAAAGAKSAPPAPPPPTTKPPAPPAASPAELPPLLLRAARLNNRSAQVAAARALDRAGALAPALRWWRKAAKAGHGEAALRFGVAAYRGLGSPMLAAAAAGWAGGGAAAGASSSSAADQPMFGEGGGGGWGGGRTAAYASPTGREGVEEAALSLARVLRPIVAAAAARGVRHYQQQPPPAVAASAAAAAAAATAATTTPLLPAPPEPEPELCGAVDAALAACSDASLRHCPRPLLREALLVHGFISLDGEGATGKSDVEAAVRALRVASALGCNEAASTLGFLYNTGQFGQGSAW
jgi:hypothetical protein